MNTKLIIWIVGILLGTIVTGVVWYVVFVPKAAPQPTVQSSVTLPVSGSVAPAPAVSGNPSLAPSPQTKQTMTLTAQNGGTIVASDFINNGVTIPDDTNKGRYVLAGNLGYCASDPQKCQAGTATDFSVFYDSTYGSFTIGLLTEPLGQARLDAEQFLATTLGLTQQDMCRLNYYVGTTFDVNAIYSTKNLGFSFCPGATVLPK